MKKRLFHCTLAALLGLALAVLLLWLGATIPARADRSIHHVNASNQAAVTTAASAQDWSPPLNVSGWYTSREGWWLKRGADGTATALWGVIDASQPTGQQGNIQVAHWPSGGPWGAPETLADGYKFAAAWRYGMVVELGGQPVAALWWAWRDVANPYTTPSFAVFTATGPNGGCSCRWWCATTSSGQEVPRMRGT